MGKNKSGLRREKGLRIVRGAGFKIHKRKQLDDVSENRRAGLNTKNKKVEGEKLVKRKQPLALKHKRRIRKAVVALSAVFIAALSLFGYGFLVGGGENFIADGIYDTAYLATDSGLTPDDLSSKTHGYNGTVSGEEDDGWKTIGYLNYTLRNQPWYYSSMAGDIAINTPLGAMTQHVATEKQFYGNVLISSESTTTPVSLMGIKIEEANQFAVISDPKVVIWRKSASSDSSTFKGKDTPWSDGQPQGATWEDFRKMRGNLQNEFSVYVINRDTLLGWSEITKNADGTYSQSFKLNHEQQPPEKSAIYYYQKQMQASGGLPSLPRFSSVEVTYTFDDKWQVLRSEIVENYTAAYGPIDANGFSSSVTEYSYDEEKAKNTFYEDYFKKYETSFGAPAEKELTVTDCLSSAFGDVLTGEAKLAVDLDLGGKSLSGIVHLNLNENDVRVSLGNIKAYLRQGEDSELYIAYGDNTKIKIPLSAITGGAEPSEPAAGIALKAGIKTAEAKTAGAPLNTDALMSQLMGGEFTIAEDKSSAILSSELDLFGIKVPLTFNFVITDGIVSLGDVETEISVLGTDIGAKLYFTENDIPALTDSEAESYVPFDVSSFISLASADALKVDVAYEDDNISLSGEVVMNLSQLAVKADLKLVLNGDGGAEKDVVAIYKEGEIYLTIGSAGETPAKIKADVNSLSELVNELLGKDADVEIGKAELLGKVLETVENIGLGNILEKILLNREFADNFAVTTENGFTLTVHGSEILEMSGAEFELGDIVISAGSVAVTVSVLGVSGELKACQAFSFDDKEYADAAELIPVINKLKDLITDGKLSVGGLVSLNLKGAEAELRIDLLSVSWENGIEIDLKGELSFKDYSQKITASYNGERASLSFGEVGITLDNSQFGELEQALADIISAATGGSTELPRLSGMEDLLALLQTEEQPDILAVINALTISGADGGVTLELGDLKVSVFDEPNGASGLFGAEALWQSEDISVNIAAHIKEYVAPEAPDYHIDYFDAAEIIPLIENAEKYISESGLTISGNVTVDLKDSGRIQVELTNAAISWKNGIEVTSKLKVTYGKLEKDISVHYGQDGIQLYYDGIGVELKQDNQKEFISAVQNLYNAIAAEANLPELKEATLQGIMEMLGMSSVDSNNINIADILNSLKLTQDETGNLCVTYGEITAELVNTNGDLSATVNYKDITATVQVAEYSEVEMPEAEYFNGEKLVPLMENVTAILKNGGVNVSGDITIPVTTGESKTELNINLTNVSVSWKNGIELTAKLKVTYGKLEKDISIHYVKECIQLYYDGIGVELKQDNQKEFVVAVQNLYNAIAAEANLPELKEATLQGIMEMLGMASVDSNNINIADILNSLELVKSEAGNLCVTYGDITAELINTNGDLSATVGYKDINATVNVGEYSEVEMPEAEYFNGEKLIPLMENITAILKDKGLNISGDITIKTSAGDIGIGISALSIKWDESNAFTFGLSATLTLDKTMHAVYAEYDGKTLSLVYDNIGVSLAQSEYDSFITAAGALYNAFAVEANLPELKEATLQGIMEMLGMSSVDSNNINIADILNSLKLTQNNSGNLCVKYGDITAELINNKGNLSVTLNYKDIAATVQVAEYAGGKSLLPSETEARYFKAQEIIPLMKEATEIVSNNGLTIGGTLSATVGSTEMQITVYGLSLNWADGIELVLDARITVNGTDHDIYAEYSAASGSLTFVYGALDNGAGVQLNVKDDAPTLEAALVKLYNRLAEVINTIVEEKPMKPAEDFNGVYEGLTPIINTISDLIKTLKNASESIKDLTGKIEDFKAEKLNIFTVINSFEYSMNSKKFTIEIGGINLSVWKDSLGFNLGVQTDSIGLELNGLTVIKTEPTASFGIEPSDLMTADDLCELTDYIAAAVEMLAKDTFKIDLKGTVTTTDERYKDVEGNVKYNVDARFEYVQGKEYPVHIETGADGGEPNLWISPDMYARVTVNLASTIIEEDSVLFDIYILDGNPEINGDGLTAGELKQDGELDVYMSLSRIPSELNDKDGANHSNPVKVYAPVSEIMTIAAAGVSMADLNNITTDYKEINDIITKVADTLDVLLVDKYLTYTKDQFSSLGASLLEQILGGKVSDIITNLLKTLGGAEESTETAPETTPQPRTDEEREQVEYGKYDRERKGALAKFTVTPTKDESGKTAKTTFEVQVKEGATASVTKENYTYKHSYTDADGAEQSEEREGTRITNVTVKNSKLNATDVIPELTVNVGYNGIEKPTELAGYTSFVGVENLLQAIVSSATHSEAGEDSAYALNNNFYITGTLDVSALGLVNHKITIDGLSVSLDENNEIEVYLRLSYKGKWGLVNGGSTVDMAIKNGMVYLKRVQTTNSSNNQLKTPETIYRIMPIDTFMADIMHQIVFIFNFGDLIAKAMESSNPPIELNYKQDYGEQLADYFKSLILSENENGDMSWQVTLHNTGINRLAGMSTLLSDGASVTLHGAREEVKNESGETLFNKYTIKSLDLSAALFSVLKISGNLVWRNPCNVYDEGSEAAKNALESSAPSVKAEEWLDVSGAYTFNDIKANIEWDKLATSINGASAEPVNPEFSTDTESYLEVVFSGDENNYDNITSHARLGNFGYYLKEGGEERLLIEKVVWFTDQNSEICSKNIADPDLSEYSKEHYGIVWGDTVRSGSTFKKIASYVAEKYNVTIHSEHYMPNYDSGDNDYVYEYIHTYGDKVDIDMSYEIRTENAGDKWYRIAYIECNGEKYYRENIDSLVIGGDADITVVWEEIPHATVTVESEHEIAGFESADGKWQKTFEIETGKDINLKELVGEIADTEQGYTFGGFTLSEGDGETSDIIKIDGATTVYVKWIEPQITVNYYSSLNVADYTQTEKEGYTSVYTISKTYTLGGGFVAETPAIEGYEFLGWFYNDGETWIKVTNVKDDIKGSDKYSNAVDLHALWYTYEMEDFTVYHTASGGWLSKTHSYDFDPVTVNAALYGNIGLLKELSFSDVNIYTVAKNDANYETNTSQHPWSGDTSKGKFEQNPNLIEEENRLEMTATFDADSYVPGGRDGKTHVVAVAEFEVMLGENVITEHRQGNNEIKKEGTING